MRSGDNDRVHLSKKWWGNAMWYAHQRTYEIVNPPKENDQRLSLCAPGHLICEIYYPISIAVFNSKECSALSGDQEWKEVENPKYSSNDKDNLQAPIDQGGEDAKLKSQGVLYHSGSLRSTPLEETVRLGGLTKPKVRCKDAGVLSGFHTRAAPKLAQEKGTKDEQVILSKRPTKFVERGGAPELAQEKGRNAHAGYRSIKEREKDSVRHDQGLFTATTTEKNLYLSERREGAIDLIGQHNWISNTLNRIDEGDPILNKEAPEAPQQKKMIKRDGHIVDAQQIATWEGKMDCAYTNGTLVRLQNLDPSYSAAGIEVILKTSTIPLFSYQYQSVHQSTEIMGEAGAKVVSSSAIEKRRSERKCPPLPKAAPWLVFPYQKKLC
ncbi:hypothetical protein C5167_042555 [Papaver somniferum]|uniref:Uncharacterized protein n=1 Tax=Papaver somniferum TaxID=3469 RepID=A0A4Y7L467_PAPSO|nr:hypothetical protein C5167_042555 [Papaver somniferum]